MATQNMKRIVRWRPVKGDSITGVYLECGHATTAMHYDPEAVAWLTCILCDARIQEVRFGIWNKEQQAYVGGQYELSPR